MDIRCKECNQKLAESQNDFEIKNETTEKDKISISIMCRRCKNISVIVFKNEY